jgi:hypothetical protein
MKIILKFYRGAYRFDAWEVDTDNLLGNPKVIHVQVDPTAHPSKAACPNCEHLVHSYEPDAATPTQPR